MTVGAVWFLGVSTGASTIHEALPRWGEVLGRPLECVGVDLPLDSPPEAYRGFLDDLAAAPALGAVVTSHKTALYRAAADRFARLDPDARLTAEVNSVRVGDDGLAGWARDPVSAGRVVDRIWPLGGNELICLGGGGTAVALITHLARRPAAPGRVLVCETAPARAAELQAFLGALEPGFGTDVLVRPAGDPWDDVIARAAAGALVVNATGLGKDRAGSPITEGARFPREAVAWELNYRGGLDFLRIARATSAAAHDGWGLFCHGWAAALTVILDLPDEPHLGDAFAHAVADLRPGMK